MLTFHIIISGKVQGVFYRSTAKKKADEIGITGCIKNTGKGNVEAIASGKREQVKNFIRWCERGPSNAVVSHVTTNQIEDAKFDDFEILR